MRIFLLLFFLIPLSMSAAENVEWVEKKLSYKAGLSDEGTLFVFKFKNSTGAEINVEKIKSSCSCMHIKSEFPFKVSDGNDAEIKAYYDFTGKVGLNRGNIEVVIDGKRIQLNVEVDIPVPVQISPRFLIWKKGERNPKDITVTLHPDWKGKISSVKSKDEKIKAEMSKDKDGLKVQITPPPVDELDKIRTWLLVNGVDEEGKHLEYRIYLILN